MVSRTDWRHGPTRGTGLVLSRRWEQSRVVSEYHYAHRQDGEALAFDDLRIAAPSDPDTVKPS